MSFTEIQTTCMKWKFVAYQNFIPCFSIKSSFRIINIFKIRHGYSRLCFSSIKNGAGTSKVIEIEAKQYTDSLYHITGIYKMS